MSFFLMNGPTRSKAKTDSDKNISGKIIKISPKILKLDTKVIIRLIEDVEKFRSKLGLIPKNIIKKTKELKIKISFIFRSLFAFST